MSLSELSRATKIKEDNLRLLEAAAIGSLPAQVFVRGFVSAYARVVGADEADALSRYRQHLHATNEPDDEMQVPKHALLPPPPDEPGRQTGLERRRVGVVMVV